MKQIKYLVIILILIMFPRNVYAICSQEELDLYNKYKNEFKVEKVFNKDNLMYNVKFYNPLPDNFKYDGDFISDVGTFLCSGSDVINCNRGYVGNYVIQVVGITFGCNEEVDNFELDLSFNEHYNDPICEGIEDFVLCDPTYNKYIDYDTFVSRVNTYKKTKINNKEEVSSEKKISKINIILNKVKNFIISNIHLIVLAIVSVIILVILIIMIVKSYKRRWKLE